MGKTKVGPLLKEELEYELTIRGLPPAENATVEDMRKSLRAAIRTEDALNQSCVVDDYPYSFEQDKAALEKKVEEVEALVQGWKENRGASSMKQCKARVEFALRRVGYACPKSKEERATLRALRTKLIVAMGSMGEDDTDSEDESGRPKGTPERVVEIRDSRIPDISKWGVKFLGERTGSINAFLERVEELRRTRGVTEAQLFQAAAELFDSRALIWYRANCQRVTTWRELVAELKAEFLPVDYDDRLWEEIRKRTQGPDEPIGVYVAIMERLFDRLGSKCEEEAKLRTIRRNLAPFLQQQLGLTDVSSIQELIKLGRMVEATRASVESFVPPSARSRRTLEPDLAYIGLVTSEVAAVSLRPDRTERPTPRCWSCGELGHISRRCPRSVWCLGCRTPGVQRYECPRCNPDPPQGAMSGREPSTDAGNERRAP